MVGSVTPKVSRWLTNHDLDPLGFVDESSELPVRLMLGGWIGSDLGPCRFPPHLLPSFDAVEAEPSVLDGYSNFATWFSRVPAVAEPAPRR